MRSLAGSLDDGVLAAGSLDDGVLADPILIPPRPPIPQYKDGQGSSK